MFGLGNLGDTHADPLEDIDDLAGMREVADLAHSFNELGQQLTEYIEIRDFIRDTFGRYVTQEVVTKLLESEGALDMGGEIREVSLIMSD